MVMRMLLLSFVQNLTGKPVFLEFDLMHYFLIGIVAAPCEIIVQLISLASPVHTKKFLDANLRACVFVLQTLSSRIHAQSF
jgi:hypothetical protein